MCITFSSATNNNNHFPAFSNVRTRPAKAATATQLGIRKDEK